MYERLKSTFLKLNIDYEIIFVNDCSPDDSEEVIRSLSRDDRNIRGISHSRNWVPNPLSAAVCRSHPKIPVFSSTGTCRILRNIESVRGSVAQGFDVVYRKAYEARSWFLCNLLIRLSTGYSMHSRMFPFPTPVSFSLRPVRCGGGSAISRARFIPEGHTRLRRIQADRSGLYKTGAAVWRYYQQPG